VNLHIREGEMKKENETLNKISCNIGKAFIIAAFYFFAFLLSGVFKVETNGIPLLWSQAGFALVVTLLYGYSALPGIFLGSLITSLAANDISIMTVFVESLGNTLGVLVPTYIIFQQKNFSLLLDNYRSIFFLILFGMIVQPLISATINVFGFFSFELISIEFIPYFWTSHFLRNALGILVFTPVLLVWFGNTIQFNRINNSIEGVVLFIVIFGFSAILFFAKMPTEFAKSISFFIIPLIIWTSVRLRTHASLLINFLTSTFFLWGISHDQGSLFSGDITHYPAYICAICTMLISSLILSASMAKLSASQQSLSFLSSHDALTGLFNRLFFETEFKRLNSSRRFPISIIMADVDDLKAVNDKFGHGTGDQVLKNIATLFSNVFRQEDIVSRYGGDEFVILLPDTNAATAKKVMARMRKQIDEYNHTHADLPINISMGISTANLGESLSGHLKNADTLMYQEKQERKRKVF
jgi:diguanylate cyclase (GGDEF)-like protein